jgi:hypothetical protein
MNRIMRRIATVGVSTVFAGGALFAIGGSATAATPHASGPTFTRVAVVQGVNGATAHAGSHGWAARSVSSIANEYRNSQSRMDPWIADQLETSDPWIIDQLGQLASSGNPSVAAS